MSSTYLMLLWHMHQPFYKDLAEGVYAMPWVRLHALKDYYGMVAMLREFPGVRVTFNLVPSLVAQIEDYAQDVAREPPYDIAFKPAGQLTAEERGSLASFAFQLNRQNLLNRYPRLRELFEKVAIERQPSAASLLSRQDLLDLQVLSQLAWFDEIYLAADPLIGSLVAKQRGYVEADKSLLRSKEIELINKVLEEYRQAQERGQVEISTSPFYHPILPLLCDSNVAAESHPGVKLPGRPFRHPEDARDQLRAAVELHQRVFGQRPQGLWPSEGSLSDEVLRLAAQEGFRWVATDEAVLRRSLEAGGAVWDQQEIYRPHRFLDGDRAISVFFRDHELSDLIGFVYSRMDAEAAALDLHRRIRAAARGTGQRPAVVSIILDGENAWEYYPGNGREFLKRFYTRLASDPEIRAVTASEALDVMEPGSLTHLVPGSWINANFDIWIGAEEDNQAWERLGEARDFLADRLEKATVPDAQAELARQELWIAEGSDWCWWYGPEHSSGQDEEFDLLFRTHLSNLYRLLGASPPDELAIPIKRPKVGGRHVSPAGRIEPRVDGRVTDYFEWLGAGVYTLDHRADSMHGGARYVEALYYGLSDRALYLRLDFVESFVRNHPRFELRVNVGEEGQFRLHASVGEGPAPALQLWVREKPLPLPSSEQVALALGEILELRLDRALLGLAPGGKLQIQASLWINQIPVQAAPQEGWLTLDLTQDFVTW